MQLTYLAINIIQFYKRVSWNTGSQLSEINWRQSILLPPSHACDDECLWLWIFPARFAQTIYKVDSSEKPVRRSHFHSEKSHGSIYVRIILKKLPLRLSPDVGPFYNQPSIFLTAPDRVKNNAAYLSSGLVCLQISVCFFFCSSLTYVRASNPIHAHALAPSWPVFLCVPRARTIENCTHPIVNAEWNWMYGNTNLKYSRARRNKNKLNK